MRRADGTIATLVLGMALWHRRSVEIATAEAVAAKAAARVEAARRAAMAPPPAAQPAPNALAAANVGKSETRLDTKSDTMMTTGVPGAATEAVPHRGSMRARHGGKGSHGRASAHGKMATKSDGKLVGKPAGKAKVDDDFIDKLLSK